MSLKEAKEGMNLHLEFRLKEEEEQGSEKELMVESVSWESFIIVGGGLI